MSLASASAVRQPLVTWTATAPSSDVLTSPAVPTCAYSLPQVKCLSANRTVIAFSLLSILSSPIHHCCSDVCLLLQAVSQQGISHAVFDQFASTIRQEQQSSFDRFLVSLTDANRRIIDDAVNRFYDIRDPLSPSASDFPSAFSDVSECSEPDDQRPLLQLPSDVSSVMSEDSRCLQVWKSFLGLDRPEWDSDKHSPVLREMSPRFTAFDAPRINESVFGVSSNGTEHERFKLQRFIGMSSCLMSQLYVDFNDVFDNVHRLLKQSGVDPAVISAVKDVFDRSASVSTYPALLSLQASKFNALTKSRRSALARSAFPGKAKLLEPVPPSITFLFDADHLAAKVGALKSSTELMSVLNPPSALPAPAQQPFRRAGGAGRHPMSFNPSVKRQSRGGTRSAGRNAVRNESRSTSGKRSFAFKPRGSSAARRPAK